MVRNETPWGGTEAEKLQFSQVNQDQSKDNSQHCPEDVMGS